MPANAAIINTRSQHQAMDWSLVLASQGIETAIEILPDTEQWCLVIAAEDYERSMAAIRQFRLENRGWAWRQKLHSAGLWFHWGALVWCFMVGLFYWFDALHANALQAAGNMDSVAVTRGQWWRLFTAINLHSSLGHLAANLTTGFLFFGLAMARYGAGVSLLAAYLAGTLGNLAGLYLYRGPYHGLGASGMVMGALGLLAVHSVFLWLESAKSTKYILSSVSAGVMLFILFGLDTKSDIVAHAGGFVGGMLLGSALALWPAERLHHKLVNFVTGFVLIALNALTWWLALR